MYGSEGMEKILSRTEIKKARNYETLLNAGKELFAEKGFQNTSIKDITNRSDVGYGTFYSYFDSKEALLEAAVDEFAQHLIEYKSVREIKGLSIRKRMYYGTKDILEFVYEKRVFLKMICSISATDPRSNLIADKVWDKIFERMFSDHSYFQKKGFSKEEISLSSTGWKIYGWALKGIIEGIVSNDMELEDIDELAKLYADMNYFTFIKEEIQNQEK